MVGHSERIRQLNERDKKWLRRLDLRLMNRILLGLYCIFVALSALDILSTLVAMYAFPGSFHELNRLAAPLFGSGILGFIFASAVLKIIPAIALLYPLLLKENTQRRPHEIRSVKLAVIVALIIVDLFYGYVVLFLNIPLVVPQI